MELEFKVVDTNTYSINNINFNYSKYIKSQKIKINNTISDYSYDSSFETLLDKLTDTSLEENKNVLKVVCDRINFIEQIITKLDDYLNLLDINEINVLKLINSINNKKYKEVKEVGEEVRKLQFKDLIDTYNSLFNYSKYVSIYGDMTIELDNLYNCKNVIKKQLIN